MIHMSLDNLDGGRRKTEPQPEGCKSPYCEPPWCKNCGANDPGRKAERQAALSHSAGPKP